MRFFLALSFLATTLSATTFFDPPNPTSATPVIAHVTIPPTLCLPVHADVTRNGSTIAIALSFPTCPLSPPGIVPFDFPVSLGVLPPGVYDVVANGDLDRGTLVVRDAAPPFEAVPNVVLTSGGQIHIRSAAGFNQPLTVAIDGHLVTAATAVTPTDILVTAPPHAAGAVDVTAVVPSGTLTVTAALDYFESGVPPDLAFFEPVVFPALVTGPGAFGSQWTTDVAMRTDNSVSMPVTPAFFGPVPPFASFYMRGANVPAGMVLYVPRQLAPRVFFDVLVRDLSRQSEALGTEIPVVREKDLYDRPFDILLVPTDPKYRTALRVFRTDGGASAHLRVFITQLQPLVDTELFLASGPQGYSSLVIPDLVQRFPELAGKAPLRIEINSETGRRVTSALVSVTNNETQHVTVLAPH
jgi:hypothetical protein